MRRDADPRHDQAFAGIGVVAPRPRGDGPEHVVLADQVHPIPPPGAAGASFFFGASATIASAEGQDSRVKPALAGRRNCAKSGHLRFRFSAQRNYLVVVIPFRQ
jgi:hypothetical protein